MPEIRVLVGPQHVAQYTKVEYTHLAMPEKQEAKNARHTMKVIPLKKNKTNIYNTCKA